jgi:hypothetical protein
VLLSHACQLAATLLYKYSRHACTPGVLAADRALAAAATSDDPVAIGATDGGRSREAVAAATGRLAQAEEVAQRQGDENADFTGFGPTNAVITKWTSCYVWTTRGPPSRRLNGLRLRRSPRWTASGMPGIP